MMGWGYSRYVPVAERRQNAQRKIDKLKRKGLKVFPVETHGRKIATTFWGKSWCTHIESFSDFDNRLPRGRTYVRNGSVCHLEVSEGCVKAIVAGSELYNVKISIKPLGLQKWGAISQSCRGKISSMLDLLSGKLTGGVMNVVCHKNEGLFPLQDEIELNCDCPDWATMCKHVAAVLYGVGARLDAEPAELFKLRAVNYEELIDIDKAVFDITSKEKGSRKRLSVSDVENIFEFNADNTVIMPTENPPVSTQINKAKPPKVLTGVSLSKRRGELNLTKSVAAKKLHISVSSLSKWESFGRKKVQASKISMEKLIRLWD